MLKMPDTIHLTNYGNCQTSLTVNATIFISMKKKADPLEMCGTLHFSNRFHESITNYNADVGSRISTTQHCKSTL